MSSLKVLILSPGRSQDAPCVDWRRNPHAKAVTALRPPGGICGHDIRAPSPGLPRAEMMPWAFLSPPSALHFDSQQVWVPPSHPDLAPHRTRLSPARTPERQAGVGGSFLQPCQGLPGLRALTTWMSGSQAMPVLLIVPQGHAGPTARMGFSWSPLIGVQHHCSPPSRSSPKLLQNLRISPPISEAPPLISRLQCA